MSKILTPFERHLKEKIADYEMPYESRSWFAIQKTMSLSKAGNYPWLVALVAAAVVTAGGSIALYHTQHSPSSAHVVITETRFDSPIQISQMISSAATLNVAEYEKSMYGSEILEKKVSANQSLNTAQNNSTSVGSNDLNIGASSTTNQAVNTANDTNSGGTLDPNSATDKTAKADIEAKAANVIGFASNVRSACEGIEVDFDVTNGPKDGSYLWNFGDGHFSDAVNPKHKYAKSGSYDVSLSVTSDKGQINTTVVNDMINIRPAPNASFLWEFVNDIPDAPAVRIINVSTNAISYDWNFNDGANSKQMNPETAIDIKGKKMIALTARNEHGCIDAAVKTISINSDFALNAPSAFTPGRETFMPSGLKQSKANFVMTIYTVSGEKVYETSNRLKGWDGKIAGIGVASSGESFRWKIIITNDLTKEQKYFNGTLTVSP